MYLSIKQMRRECALWWTASSYHPGPGEISFYRSLFILLSPETSMLPFPLHAADGSRALRDRTGKLANIHSEKLQLRTLELGLLFVLGQSL